MKYIQVENNEIVGNPQELPRNWQNISNFYILDNQTLKNYGWYPFEEEESNLQENEKITGWSIDIEEDKVVKRAIKRPLTQEEIDIRNVAELTRKWTEVRSRRNQLLSESDWTQLPDAPIGNKEDWKTYRQNLRDVTQAPNPDVIAWPVKPLVIPPAPTPVEPIQQETQQSQQETPPIEETTNEESDPNLGG